MKQLRLLSSSFKLKEVETTIVSDVYSGTLAFAEGKLLVDVVIFAYAAYAISVTKLDAQSSAPIRKEIDDFLRLNID